MRIELPWGETFLKLDLPDTWDVIQPQPSNPQPGTGAHELEIIKAALRQPAGTTPLSEKRLGGKKIIIIVDDNTRPTPVSRFFHLVTEELTAAGGETADMLVIPALGIHTPMTEAEMAEKIGAANLARIPWENHRAFDPDANAFMGNTRRGTPVSLNRRLAEADLIVLIGLIEPHLMAGFGGGLKNILPGVASAETIGRHHEILTEPPYQANRVGRLPEQNSFRLDLEECRGMIRADIFCVNVALNHNRTVIACFAGDPIAAHRAGIRFTLDRSGLEMNRQVDGVIVNAHPMDINFKQSMKCVGNALPALKPGGTVMGFLRAEKGLDDIPEPKRSPLPLPVVKKILRLIGPSRVYAFLNLTRKGLNIEERFLYYYTMQLIRQYELLFFVPSLTAETVKALFFFNGFTHTPQDVIRAGVKRLGPRASVAVFPEGGATFPVIR
ncbi:MAG: nickel-dependent lactate racemase [Thermodesulfobacteriota bacterium]